MIILAYIDAGSGSMLIQILLAGALAIPFFLRSSIAAGWRRLRGQRQNEEDLDLRQRR